MTRTSEPPRPPTLQFVDDVVAPALVFFAVHALLTFAIDVREAWFENAAALRRIAFWFVLAVVLIVRYARGVFDAERRDMWVIALTVASLYALARLEMFASAGLVWFVVDATVMLGVGVFTWSLANALNQTNPQATELDSDFFDAIFGRLRDPKSGGVLERGPSGHLVLKPDAFDASELGLARERLQRARRTVAWLAGAGAFGIALGGALLASVVEVHRLHVARVLQFAVCIVLLLGYITRRMRVTDVLARAGTVDRTLLRHLLSDGAKVAALAAGIVLAFAWPAVPTQWDAMATDIERAEEREQRRAERGRGAPVGGPRQGSDTAERGPATNDSAAQPAEGQGGQQGEARSAGGEAGQERAADRGGGERGEGQAGSSSEAGEPETSPPASESGGRPPGPSAGCADAASSIARLVPLALLLFGIYALLRQRTPRDEDEDALDEVPRGVFDPERAIADLRGAPPEKVVERAYAWLASAAEAALRFAPDQATPAELTRAWASALGSESEGERCVRQVVKVYVPVRFDAHEASAEEIAAVQAAAGRALLALAEAKSQKPGVRTELA